MTGFVLSVQTVDGENATVVSCDVHGARLVVQRDDRDFAARVIGFFDEHAACEERTVVLPERDELRQARQQT